MTTRAQSKVTLIGQLRRTTTIAGIVATALLLLGSVGPRAWGQKTGSGKVTLIVTNVAMGSSGYGGSNCDSNTYSGQCLSGACACYVSGIVPVKVIVSVAGKPTKSAVAAAELFLTVDTGSTTGAPGCSPMYGVMQGLNKKLVEVMAIDIVGTLCPQKSGGAYAISGGWGIDFAAGLSASGPASGVLNGANNLKLTLTGVGK